MKRKAYRVLIVLLCSMFLFTVTSFADAGSIPDEVRLRNQSDANNYYATLLSSFTNENGEMEYPDYYGGSYLDNKGNLVVQLCENNRENREKVLRSSGSRHISFVSVKNAYKDLYSAYEEFNELCSDSSELREAFTDLVYEFYIDENNNSLTVGLKSLDDESISRVCSLTSFPDVLRFEQAARPTPAVTINPGVKVVLNGNGENIGCSAGFRCYYPYYNNYLPAFVTCAHYIIGGNVYDAGGFSNGTLIGYVAQLLYAGSVDASVVVFTDSHNMSSVTNYDHEIITGSNYTTYLATNTVIKKEGDATGSTSGSILSSSCTATFNNTTLTDLIKSDCYVHGGDSGGICYTWVNGDCVVVGITTGYGYEASFPFFFRSYFCQAKNIVSAFGIIPY